MRREVTIYIGPDGSRQIFEDHASELLIDALVIDDRGAEPRTARLVVHDVDRLVTSLDRLLDDLSDTRQPDLRPSATPSSFWALLLRLLGRNAASAPRGASPLVRVEGAAFDAGGGVPCGARWPATGP